MLHDLTFPQLHGFTSAKKSNSIFAPISRLDTKKKPKHLSRHSFQSTTQKLLHSDQKSILYFFRNLTVLISL